MISNKIIGDIIKICKKIEEKKEVKIIKKI